MRTDLGTFTEVESFALMASGYLIYGLLIYGLETPQSTKGIELNPVDHVVPAETPTASTNGTPRLAEIPVIKAPSFTIKVKLEKVILLGSTRDADADGDNALLRIDGGIDVNGNGKADFRAPENVTYGYEEFTDKYSPLFGDADGEFMQKVDATKLSPGLHFVEIRAFRRRNDGGPAVYSVFKKVVRIER